MAKIYMINRKIIGFKKLTSKSTLDKLKTMPSFQYYPKYKSYGMHILHYPLLKQKYNIKFFFIEKVFKENYMQNEIKKDIKIKTSKLLNYQITGVNKLITQDSFLLTDDTGLGKSLQGLSAIQELNCKKVLIVTFSSLKEQWQNECEKFVWKDSVVINGSPKQRKKQWLGDKEIYICNYETLLKDKIAHDINFDAIILDEAQKIKNPKSKINECINKLKSKNKWVLTATPIENNLTDLYSLLKFIEPELFTNYYKFLDLYTIRKQMKARGRTFMKVVGFKNTEELKNTIAPILLMREKKDVLKDLPPITEQNRYITMHKEQQKQYDSIIDLIRNPKEALNETEKRGRALAQISLLKSCLHGTEVINQTKSRLWEEIYIPEKNYSAKLDELDNILPTLKGQTIIFSESVRMCKIIIKKLKKMNIIAEIITGEDNTNTKNLKINDFKQEKFQILVSSNAIAFGVNIQCAQNIINMDLPWNPAVLKNRIARIYRMGQQNNVLVINLLVKHSIDIRVLKKLGFKNNLFNNTIPGALTAIDILNDIINEEDTP